MVKNGQEPLVPETSMIEFELLKDAGALVVKPKSALSADDFSEISRTIDPYIREKGKLTGLLIEAPSFLDGTASARSSNI